MTWSDEFTKEIRPEISDITKYINNPFWTLLCEFIENTYLIKPLIEFSKCSLAKGWNVKYKKGSRSICTLYPKKGYFTILISIGSNEVEETEFILPSCTSYLQEIYKNTNLFNGSRWLMIDVTSEEIFRDVKNLISIRAKYKKK